MNAHSSITPSQQFLPIYLRALARPWALIVGALSLALHAVVLADIQPSNPIATPTFAGLTGTDLTALPRAGLITGSMAALLSAPVLITPHRRG